MTTFGYARVSTVGQSLEAQLAELTAQGCEQIFQEKISCKKRDRAELERMLRRRPRNTVRPYVFFFQALSATKVRCDRVTRTRRLRMALRAGTSIAKWVPIETTHVAATNRR